MIRFQVREFITQEFGGVRALHEKLSPLGEKSPTREAMWKWIQRGSLPLEWFLLLAVVSGKTPDTLLERYCTGIGECAILLSPPKRDTTGASSDVFG